MKSLEKWPQQPGRSEPQKMSFKKSLCAFLSVISSNLQIHTVQWASKCFVFVSGRRGEVRQSRVQQVADSQRSHFDAVGAIDADPKTNRHYTA